MNNPLGIRPKTVIVEHPDLDDSQVVRVRKISARERLEVVGLDNKDPLYHGKLLALALCNDDGGRSYADDMADALMEIPAEVADAILGKWMDLNGLRKQSTDDKEKNS